MRIEPGVIMKPTALIVTSRVRGLVLIFMAALSLCITTNAWARACSNAATGNWTAAATWAVPCNAAGGPLVGDDVTIINNTTVTVDAAGLNANSVRINAGNRASTLTFAAGSSLNVVGNVTINAPTGNVTKGITVLTGALTVGGNVALTGGTSATRKVLLSASTGSITINGGLTSNSTVATSATVALTGAGTITVNGAAGVTNGDTLTIGSGRFNVTNAAGIFSNSNAAIIAATTLSSGQLAVAGALTNGATNTITISTTGSLSAGGTLTNNGTVTLSAAGTVTASGTLANTTTGTVTVGTGTVNAATFTNANVVTVSSGLISVSGAYTNTAVGDTVTISAAGGRLTVGGTLTNNGTVTAATGTVSAATFSNANLVTVSTGLINVSGTYSNTAVGKTITITGAGGRLTVGGTLTNAGSIIFSTAAGGIVNANGAFSSSGIVTNTTAGILNIGGAATVNGTFTAGTGRVVFNGSSAQTASGTALTFYNVTVSNASGVTLANNLTVGGTLTLTTGVLTTGVNTLIVTAALCAAPSVSRTGGWVSGKLQKRIPANASACTFEVGGASVYTPMTATFIAGAVAANITASSTDGDHPQISTSLLDPNLTANRYWSLTSTVAEATAFSVVFNFNASDLDTDAQPTLFKVKSYSGGAWSAPTTGTLAATSTQATGVTLAAATLKAFVIGETAPLAGSSSFNAVENLASATAGKIYTKLSGTAFSIDLVALNAARSAQNATFQGIVKVELLNASDNSAGLDANGCRSSWTVIQTLASSYQFLLANAGRKQNVPFSESRAWPNVRVRVTYPYSGSAAVIGCSSDNFAIRPLSFTGVTGGAPLNMNNAGTSGTPVAIAGSGTFTLIATTGVVGYTGSPKVDSTAISAHAGAVQNGTLSGSFPAALSASGTSTATSAFTYSEVGNFKLLGLAATAGSTTARGVYDDTFTAVDASDCTSDFSNTLVAGKYGCKFGLTSDSGYFGRFKPDHFAISAPSVTAACHTSSAFTYFGQDGVATTFTLTAQNASNATTMNYDGAWTKLPLTAWGAAPASAGSPGFGFAATGWVPSQPAAPSSTLAASATAPTGAWSGGTASVTARHQFGRSTTAPVAPTTVSITALPVDSDGVTATVASAIGSATLLYGRLRMISGQGSMVSTYTLQTQAQYWNGSYWLTNTNDSCTVYAAANALLAGSTGSTVSSVGSPISQGFGSILLSLPSSAGTATICLHLASTGSCAATAGSIGYLLGNWGGASYTYDPSASVNFGAVGLNSRGNWGFLYRRENF